MPAHVRGRSVPGDAAYARAYRLYGEHQRKCENGGPQYAIAKASAHLRIGGDAAGIVVCGTGNKARSKSFP